jgi:hypothetical protein
VRRAAPPDQPTRTVVAVDSTTGASWFSAVTGASLGGFLGRSADGAFVFAQPGEPMEIEIVDPDVPPAEIFPTGHPDTAELPHVITGSGIVIGDGDALTSTGLDGSERWSRRSDLAVQSVTSTEAGILVSIGDPAAGCD